VKRSALRQHIEFDPKRPEFRSGGDTPSNYCVGGSANHQVAMGVSISGHAWAEHRWMHDLFLLRIHRSGQMSEHPENPFEPDTVCTDSKSVTGLK